MSGIEGLNPNVTGAASLTGGQAQQAAGKEGTGFGNVLKDYLQQVNDLQQEADKSVRELVTGQVDNVHEVVVAMSEADLSFRLMMQIRNKLVDAYHEIMRMQV